MNNQTQKENLKKKRKRQKACKISGKIEFSHHIFVMAFFIRRKQRKAPQGGARIKTV